VTGRGGDENDPPSQPRPKKGRGKTTEPASPAMGEVAQGGATISEPSPKRSVASANQGAHVGGYNRRNRSRSDSVKGKK